MTTDARLRPATSVEMATELNRLFRCLELKTGSPEDKIEGYLIALEGASHYALTTAVNKLIRGEVDGVSRKFCPTPPELSAVIRDEMAFVRKQNDLARERMQLEDKRPVAAQVKTLFDRVAEAKQKMVDEGRSLLFEVSSHADMLARRRSMPQGSVYVSILGAAYGPPGYQPVAAPEPEIEPEKPPPIDDDIPW